MVVGYHHFRKPPNISPMDRSRELESPRITRPVEATDAALDAFAAVVRATVLAFAFLAAQLVYGPRSCDRNGGEKFGS